MPTYDYFCKKCQKNIELFHSASIKMNFCDCGKMGQIKKIIISTPTVINKEKNYLIEDVKNKYLPNE